MKHHQWHSMPREQAGDVMQKISSAADAAVFSGPMTEVTYRPLPFYSHFKQFRLTNYATMPCFSMDYLGNPETGVFYALDGLANTLYDVNDDDRIALTAETVIEYIDFFFTHVQGPDGDIYLIKTPEDLPMLGSLPENQQASVRESHRPLTVDPQPAEDGFLVGATVYYGGSLISAEIFIRADGQISIQNQSLLLQGIHFPMSPVEHNYMGE